jgi:hypothetical protein
MSSTHKINKLLNALTQYYNVEANEKNLFAVWKGENAAEHFKLRIRRLYIMSRVIQLRHGVTEIDCMEMWGVQRLRTNKTPMAFPSVFFCLHRLSAESTYTAVTICSVSIRKGHVGVRVVKGYGG